MIKAVLKRHLPHIEIWAFGSRVRGEATDSSNLDLVIISHRKTSSKLLTALNIDFEESNLPFKVDILDWQRISKEFQTIIEEKYVVFLR